MGEPWVPQRVRFPGPKHHTMGVFVELNDTLQLTKEQGFPSVLDLERHLKTPLTAEAFEGTIFEFKNKPDIRMYKSAPVRNFLVENRSGKWIYWGLVEMIEVTHDHQAKTTSGKFRLLRLYTPEQMKQAHHLIDTRPEVQYFAD